jgi:hypothetical protein
MEKKDQWHEPEIEAGQEISMSICDEATLDM